GGLGGTEGTGANVLPAAGAGVDQLYPDSTNHCWHENLNNTDVGCTMVRNGANTMGASATIDLSLASTTAGFSLPHAAGAIPTADGFVSFNTTTHALVTGSNGT